MSNILNSSIQFSSFYTGPERINLDNAPLDAPPLNTELNHELEEISLHRTSTIENLVKNTNSGTNDEASDEGLIAQGKLKITKVRVKNKVILL